MGFRRRVWAVGTALVVALGAALGVGQLALRQFQQAVLASLGPGASVGTWHIGFGGIALEEVRLRALPGAAPAWPAEDELRAQRVVLEPVWASLWPGAAEGWRLRRVQIHGAHLTVLREPSGGLRVLPSLTGRPGARSSAVPPRGAPAAASGGRPAPDPASPTPARRVRIDAVQIDGAQVDLYDASIRRPAHRLAVSQLQARLGPIDWPALDQPLPIRLSGRLAGQAGPGAGRDGTLQIEGQVTPARRDATLSVRLRGVDLRVLEPYLLRVNEGGIERGVVDLDLDATVRAARLQAPGRVVFTGLVLAQRPGVLGSFAGLPQRLVLAAVRERGRVELRFTLSGRLDDPAFSLNENLSTRVAVGLAESLGVSVGGAVEGLGQVIKGLFGK